MFVNLIHEPAGSTRDLKRIDNSIDESIDELIDEVRIRDDIAMQKGVKVRHERPMQVATRIIESLPYKCLPYPRALGDATWLKHKRPITLFPLPRDLRDMY